MELSSNLRNYIISLMVFLALDIPWILLVAKSLYNKYLGDLMTSKPNYIAAGIFYIIFIIGLLYFVINPALEKEDIKIALFNGALLGLLAYSTFALTNQATLTNWNVILSISDIAWGTILSALTATISYYLIRLF